MLSSGPTIVRQVNLGAFFGLLEQSLTLGVKRVSPARLPQLFGFVLYVAVAGLLIGMFARTGSRRALLFGFVVLGLLMVLGVLLLLHKVVSHWIVDVLALVTGLSFVAVTAYSIVVLTNSETPHPPDREQTVRVFGTVTYENKDVVPRAVVTVLGYPVQAVTSEAGFFELSVPRSSLHGDSVTLVVKGPAGSVEIARPIAKLPVTIVIRGAVARQPSTPAADAYARIARTASDSVARGEELLRTRHFEDAARLTRGISDEASSLRAALGAQALPEAAGLQRVREIDRIARDSLEWLREQQDNLEQSTAPLVVRARQFTSTHLFCEALRVLRPVTERLVALAKRYPDFRPDGDSLLGAARLWVATQDSLRVHHLEGSCA